MKNYLVIIFLLLTIIGYGQSKRLKFVDVSGGYEANGLFGRVAFSYFHKENNFIRIGGQFHIEDFTYSENDVPVQLYVGSVEYNKGLWYSEEETWAFYAGAGILGGYESVNNGKEYLEDGRRVLAESKFIYGGTIGIELDRYISIVDLIGRHDNLLQFFINAKLNYYANSDVGSIQPNLSAGIRIGF